FIKGELLEAIEWTDDSRDTLSFRFPDDDKAIKNGAQLIVREPQTVQFLYLGEFGDTFGPGKHTLTTDNIPGLTKLKSAKYGLEMTSFILENVSVPPEVEQAIDKRSSMGAVGNLNDYVKFQMAQGMEKGGSAGGVATEMAVGLAMAKQMIEQQGSVAPKPGTTAGGGAAAGGGGLPELLSPGDIANALKVSEGDVLAIIESGELAAKKIGSTW